MAEIHRSTLGAAAAVLAVLVAAPVAAQEGSAAEPPPATLEQPAPDAQGEQGPATQGLYSLQVREVAGRRVSNVAGDKLGDVTEVARGIDDGRLYVLVSVGGFLGIGDRQVALPVDDLQLSEDELVMTTTMDEDMLKQQAISFQADQYQVVSEDVSLAEAASAPRTAGSAGMDILPSFASLDRNGDGVISRDEARAAVALDSNWEQLDTDQDGQLTESEFSAFEQLQSREQPLMPPGGMQQHDRGRAGEAAPR